MLLNQFLEPKIDADDGIFFPQSLAFICPLEYAPLGRHISNFSFAFEETSS